LIEIRLTEPQKEKPVMGNHNIVWVGMDTDAKKNQIALYRGWDNQPAAEWEAGMDANSA
jgi:hypothetical protein